MSTISRSDRSDGIRWMLKESLLASLGMDFRIRGAQPGEGRRKGFELRFRHEVNRDRGIVVERFQRFDRREDVYVERIIDPATGEVIHETMEPLSEHRRP